MIERPLGFYEFFAGGGMARLGLGDGWRCLLSNEICEKKASAYRLNFGSSPELRVGDVQNLKASDLPAGASLAWASFPCQDLSLAGNGAGLEGPRSGTFRPFWQLMESLAKEDRGVPVVVLENVTGALTSCRGNDFQTLISTLAASGRRLGPLVIDAKRFLPQSRPRLFVVAVTSDVRIPPDLIQESPSEPWHTQRLRAAWKDLPEKLKDAWIWWRLPVPARLTRTLTGILEDNPSGVAWHTAEQTQRLLSLMSQTNLGKVQKAQDYGKRIAGTVYKRIRVDEAGKRVQRAEVRFDQIGGCLRTPVGGSSRQLILLVEGRTIRSRLLSSREAARLMGLPDSYKLPEKYNDAYRLAGDGLAVPVVSWLERHLLRSLALSSGVDAAKVA